MAALPFPHLSAGASPDQRAVGVAWMVYCGLVGAAGVAAGIAFVGMALLMAVLPDSRTGAPAPTWVAFAFGGFGALVGGILGVYGALGATIGWYVTRGRTWAKWGALVLAITQVAQFPVGTLLGIATFVVMFRAEPAGGRGAAG